MTTTEDWMLASHSHVIEKSLVVLWQEFDFALDVGQSLWRHRETARRSVTTTVFDAGRRPVTLMSQKNHASLCYNNRLPCWTSASRSDVIQKSLVAVWQQLIFMLDVGQSLWRHRETVGRSVTTCLHAAVGQLLCRHRETARRSGCVVLFTGLFYRCIRLEHFNASLLHRSNQPVNKTTHPLWLQHSLVNRLTP